MDQAPPPDSSRAEKRGAEKRGAETSGAETSGAEIAKANSGRSNAGGAAARPDGGVPYAEVSERRPFNFIWLIPIVALLVAGFLGFKALRDRGETITVTFRTADGLIAGQTHVKHKAVDLGQVRSIDLSQDMTHVEVRIDMRREADRVLTDQARFWVVRPRFSAANVSGLDTLVSGSYIELDPGTPDDKRQTQFTGLEEPPAIRSDEPGKTFTLKAPRIGSIGSGSPVFYRNIEAGEVLGYDLGPDGNSVAIHVFIRAPFDKFVHENTAFWNVSGLSVDLNGQGVQVRVASLQALISGAIAFDVPRNARPGGDVKPDEKFALYSDESAADTAGYRNKIRFVTYVQGSVRGLSKGAPVQLYGIQIGSVTDVHLEFDPKTLASRVAIKMEVEPERMLRPDQMTSAKPIDVSRTLVDRGLRVQLQTTNYLTGGMAADFVFLPDAPKAEATERDGVIVLPSAPGGLDSITSNLSEITTKLARLPLDDIARNLNSTLAGASEVANGQQLKSALTSMSAAMANVQDLVKKLDAGLAPTMKELPGIAQSLQTTVARANSLIGSVNKGYGGDSEFSRNLERLLDQVSDTARSVRLLADYLDQHPEALVRGRTNLSNER